MRWIEIEHDVEPQRADFGKQVGGQHAAALAVAAAEAEEQLDVAVGGQASQFLTTPVCQFDQHTDMVREVAAVGQPHYADTEYPPAPRDEHDRPESATWMSATRTRRGRTSHYSVDRSG